MSRDTFFRLFDCKKIAFSIWHAFKTALIVYSFKRQQHKRRRQMTKQEQYRVAAELHAADAVMAKIRNEWDKIDYHNEMAAFYRVQEHKAAAR